jgi:hypothetical protein
MGPAREEGRREGKGGSMTELLNEAATLRNKILAAWRDMLLVLADRTIPDSVRKELEDVRLVFRQTWADMETAAQEEAKAAESAEGLAEAEWDTAYVNDLPDSCSAVILSGGEKDADGKTTPRSLRKLPYRKSTGAIDLPHLRNALSRLPQMTGVPQAKRDAARSKLLAAAKKELPSYQESAYIHRGPMAQRLAEGEWDEALHPRGEGGKFGSGGGTSISVPPSSGTDSGDVGGGIGGLVPDATGGEEHTIAGKKYNTADVVNKAISRGGTPDLEKASQLLQGMTLLGYAAPTPESIQRYATEKVILDNIGYITGSNTSNQIGKWDMSDATSITKSFNKYLGRRTAGIHQRWTAGKRRY